MPPLIEAEVREPAEIVPPAIEEVRRPATETVPPAMPPVTVAELAKDVSPAPESEAKVMVPVTPVNWRAPGVVLALVTPARVRPVPEIVAKPVLSRASVAVL